MMPGSEFQKNTLRRLKLIEDKLDRLKNFASSSGASPFTIKYATYDCTNPPTQADCIAAFGLTPSGAGTNFIGYLNDNSASLREYIVFSDGTYFWASPLAKTLTPIAPATIPDLTYVFANGKVTRARNFVSGGGSPTWEDVTGSVAGTGTGRDMVLDTVSPKDVAYRVWQDVVEVTTNLNASPPTWTSKLTTAAVQAATGRTSVEFYRCDVSAKEQDLFYVAWKHSGNGAGISYSTDQGATWTHHDTITGGGSGGSGVRRIKCDPQTPGKVWFLGDNGQYHVLYYSTNYGLTWTGVLGPAFSRVNDFDIDTINGQVIIAHQFSWNTYNSHNGGASFIGPIQLDTTKFSVGLFNGYGIQIYAQDANDAILTGPGPDGNWLARTVDGGTTWTYPYQFNLLGSSGSVAKLHRWPYDKNQIFWLYDKELGAGASPFIGYTMDMFITPIEKISNWTTVTGVDFLHPVKIIAVWVL